MKGRPLVRLLLVGGWVGGWKEGNTYPLAEILGAYWRAKVPLTARKMKSHSRAASTENNSIFLFP